ncbi:MAG: MmgE/PrpD family protein [Pseudomonadota bacterium]
MEITKRLAQFIVNHTYSMIPSEVRELAKHTIIDTVGCCIGGYTEAKEECEWIVDLVKDLGGKPESSVFMNGFLTSPPLAALANGTMIHSIDFDDTHMGAISHFSASLVPTVFSLGEKYRIDGPSLLEAFIVGFDVGARVGRQMMPSHYKYWHPTSTFGSLASAAAASKLMKLDEMQTEYALGLSADLAGGLRYGVDKGDYSKSLHPGFAAMRGVMLTLLVSKGADGPKGILEYPTGFCYAFSEDPRIEKIGAGLGESYEITSNGLKAYPSILISHASIQAVLELIKEHNIRSSEIVRISLTISHTAKGQGQNYDPETPLAARLSIPFCVALAALDGEVSISKFTKERLHDTQLREMMKKIEIQSDPSLNTRYPETLASIVELETRERGLFRTEVIYPKGNIKNPMSRDDVIKKFKTLCSASIPEKRSEEILKMLFELDQLDSIQGLADLLRGQ